MCRLTTLVTLSILLGSGLPHLARAELYERAQQATRLETSRTDFTGMSARGGVNLHTGSTHQNVTVLRSQASVGGTCGAFDFRGSIQQAFEELPEMFEALAYSVLEGLPMLALCYNFPTVCATVQHWQALLNAAIHAKYAQCQSIQNAMAYAGLRLRGGATSQCLEEATSEGMTVQQAMRECEGTLSSMRGPRGTRGTEVHLVEETLDAAGVSPETRAVASAVLGEVTLRTGNGRLTAQTQQPTAAMLARYEQHRQDADARLRSAIEEYQRTGTLTDDTLQGLSVPGQPLPRGAIDALASMQQDPARQQAHLGRLSTSTAITQLTWECHEVQEQLAAAMDGNQHLTDEQRRLLERRYQALQRSLAQVMQKAAVVQEHLQPAIDALLRDWTATQHLAGQAGLKAPTVTVGPGAYGPQHSLGYSR